MACALELKPYLYNLELKPYTNNNDDPWKNWGVKLPKTSETKLC